LSACHSLLYRNDDGIFTDVRATLPDVEYSSVAWGDYDSDGDLDLLLSGHADSGFVASVYRSDSALVNTPPVAPANLSAQVVGSRMTFSWDAATDTETPAAGLTYNLRVGTTLGGSEISSAMADSSGLRLVAALGNLNQNLSWSIELPDPPSPTYYWSVQALDACFAGSPFAPEQTLNDPATGAPALRVQPIAYALHARARRRAGGGRLVRARVGRARHARASRLVGGLLRALRVRRFPRHAEGRADAIAAGASPTSRAAASIPPRQPRRPPSRAARPPAR
jgi:hypothetical protein